MMGILGISNLVDKPECTCPGHQNPNVWHITPCCDGEHITQQEYEAKQGLT